MIDLKKYAARRIDSNASGDAFVIDGRHRPRLAASMSRQVQQVTAALAEGPIPDVTVRAAYCFVGADVPWRRLRIDGVPVLTPSSVTEILGQPGPLDARTRQDLHLFLSWRFPRA